MFKSIGLFCLCLSLSFYCISQKKVSANEIEKIRAKSQNVQISDSLKRVILNESDKEGIIPKIVNKNATFYQMLFNEALSKEERVLVCDMLLYRFKKSDKVFTMDLVEKLKKELLKK
jgi:hypothetical protein